MTTNGDTPAFPCPDNRECSGMTLREWYAGQALAGVLADPSVSPQRPEDAASCALFCVEMANALLAALEVRPEEGA